MIVVISVNNLESAIDERLKLRSDKGSVVCKYLTLWEVLNDTFIKA